MTLSSDILHHSRREKATSELVRGARKRKSVICKVKMSYMKLEKNLYTRAVAATGVCRPGQWSVLPSPPISYPFCSNQGIVFRISNMGV